MPDYFYRVWVAVCLVLENIDPDDLPVSTVSDCWSVKIGNTKRRLFTQVHFDEELKPMGPMWNKVSIKKEMLNWQTAQIPYQDIANVDVSTIHDIRRDWTPAAPAIKVPSQSLGQLVTYLVGSVLRYNVSCIFALYLPQEHSRGSGSHPQNNSWDRGQSPHGPLISSKNIHHSVWSTSRNINSIWICKHSGWH